MSTPTDDQKQIEWANDPARNLDVETQFLRTLRKEVDVEIDRVILEKLRAAAANRKC